LTPAGCFKLFVAVALLQLLILLAPTATFAAQSHADVTLELWTWSMRPWFNGYMTDLISEFQTQNPGITVDWVDVPDDTIVRKFFCAGAAGKLPDVVTLPDKVFLRFAGLDGLAPLDAALPGDPRSIYVKPALDQCRLHGKLFALPWYLSTEISVVNTSLLARGGLTPATVATHWDQLLSQARPFYQKTGKHLFMLRLGETDLLNMITAEGLEPIKPAAGGGYHSNLMAPEVIAVVEKWVDACRDGDIPRESATAGYPETVQAFKEQRIALLNADAVRSVKNDSPRVYQSLEVRPGITGKIGKTGVAVVQIAVGAQTQHPLESSRLAWFMTSARWQERLCRQASRVPSTKSSLSLAEFSLPADPADKLKLALGIGCDQLRSGLAKSFIPPTGEWPEMEKIFGDELKRSMIENVPVKTSLQRVDRQWNDLLETETTEMGK
jgi:putative chitobiose transport system substrate-binding protein